LIDTKLLEHSIADLDEDQVNEIIDSFLAKEQHTESEARALIEACQQGMETVGEAFERSECFVGDLVKAGALLASSIERLKTVLSGDAENHFRGLVVLGTVAGDIHYIGKNIYRVMMEAAGYRVIDMGIDKPPETFVQFVRRYNPDIVGLSGLLTPSIEVMRETVDALKKEGLRNKVRIQIGGSVVTDSACNYVKADGWSRNAYEAVQECKKWK
jgi:methanogenic corrinoid protein MtbC1